MFRGPPWGRGPDGGSKSSPSDYINLREIAEEKVLNLQVTVEFWYLFVLYCGLEVWGWLTTPVLWEFSPGLILLIFTVFIIGSLWIGFTLKEMAARLWPPIMAVLLFRGLSID